MIKQVLVQFGRVVQWQDTEKYSYGAPTEDAAVIPVTDAQWAKQDALKWVVNGKLSDKEPAPPPAPLEIIRANKVAHVQAHMDAQARALNYDSIANAITYADEPAVPKFQAEGQAFRAWRSLVWARCYEILEEVQGGARAIPSDDELIAELPKLQIPSS